MGHGASTNWLVAPWPIPRLRSQIRVAETTLKGFGGGKPPLAAPMAHVGGPATLNWPDHPQMRAFWRKHA